jgi:hypothetical protein
LKHYLFVVEGGTEPYTLGPFETPEERLETARGMYENGTLTRGSDNVFVLDCEGEPNVGSFTNEELE